MTIKQALSLHPDAPLFLPWNKAWIYANADFELTKSQETKFKKLIGKRKSGVPAAYLLGRKEFFGLDFLVNKDVLIPRPETELLVELALSPSLLQREGGGEFSVIDIGTGSGNIIISLAKNLKSKANLFAIDSSSKALNVAKRNARRHGVAKKIKFVHGSLFSPLQKGRLRWGGCLIIANLPYLTPRQIRANPDLSHEPRSALVAGRDGLKYYRELFRQLTVLLHRHPRGGGGPFLTLLLEHDPSQVAALKTLAKKHFPKSHPKFHRDLARRFRVMEICVYF